MAINLYSPLLRKDHVDSRLEMLEGLISNGIIQYAATAASDETLLQQRIKALQEQEKHFFDLLNITQGSSINDKFIELNSRVSSCNLRLSNLNGQMIEEEILNLCSAAYHERLLKFLQEEISSGAMGESVQQALSGPEWKKEFIRYINENVPSKSGQKGRLRASAKGISGFEGDFEELTAKVLTSAAKDKIETLVTEHLKKQGITTPVYQYLINNSSVVVDPMDWTGVVKGLTPSQAEKLLDSAELEIINKNIEELIVRYAAAQNEPLLRQVVNLVIRSNKFAFFVGKNLKAITGLLGEIQGLYYLSTLTNTPPSHWYSGQGVDYGPFAKMRWVADTRRGNLSQKASIDILLEDIGIQVKNTTRDITDSYYNTVNFSGKGISLNSLARALNIEDSLFIDAVSSLYQTYGFNVEYQTKGEVYMEGDNPIFVPTREKMETLITMTERLFGIWLECAMHMGTNKSFETALETNVNAVYFINGLFYSSSEILMMLYDALKKGSRSGARISAIMPRKGSNIVSYLNDKKRQESMYGISKQTRDIDLRVTMSFDFNSLLK